MAVIPEGLITVKPLPLVPVIGLDRYTVQPFDWQHVKRSLC